MTAQQDPLVTQYMFDFLLINPAYAGSHDQLSASLLTRKQWLGLQGSPFTSSLSAHSPLNNKINITVTSLSEHNL